MIRSKIYWFLTCIAGGATALPVSMGVAGRLLSLATTGKDSAKVWSEVMVNGEAARNDRNGMKKTSVKYSLCTTGIGQAIVFVSGR